MVRRVTVTTAAAFQRARRAGCGRLAAARLAPFSCWLSTRASPPWCILPERTHLPPTVCTGCAPGASVQTCKLCPLAAP